MTQRDAASYGARVAQAASTIGGATSAKIDGQNVKLLTITQAQEIADSLVEVANALLNLVDSAPVVIGEKTAAT